MEHNKEKQIEEMAKAILDVDRLYYGMECDEIQAKVEATAIYDKGYRKASDEATENHIKAIRRLEPQNDYCAGGKKALDITLKVLAEL